jgi:hypothetical protein
MEPANFLRLLHRKGFKVAFKKAVEKNVGDILGKKQSFS